MNISSNKKTIYIIILFLFLLTFCLLFQFKKSINKKIYTIKPVQFEKNDICSYRFTANNPDDTVIEISAKNKDIDLLFLLNKNKFYSSTSEIVSEINNITKTKRIEKFFEFVKDNSQHYYPLSAEEWYHSPILFINSLGFGFCDDISAVLKNIYQSAGYNARLVELGGHVVTELEYEEGKWAMFDPDYGVFFENRTGQIASVKELSEDTGLITAPVERMETKLNPYTKNYAKLFSSTDNNQIVETAPIVSSNEPYLKVPVGAKFFFPLTVMPKPLAIEGKYVEKYKNLKLVLPKGYKGKIDNFLLIHSISGKGKIKINNKNIYDENFNNIPLEVIRFAESVEILEAKTEIQVNYFINPNRFEIEKENLIKFEGEDCDIINMRIFEKIGN